jgi:hypothetical protein
MHMTMPAFGYKPIRRLRQAGLGTLVALLLSGTAFAQQHIDEHYRREQDARDRAQDRQAREQQQQSQAREREARERQQAQERDARERQQVQERERDARERQWHEREAREREVRERQSREDDRRRWEAQRQFEAERDRRHWEIERQREEDRRRWEAERREHDALRRIPPPYVVAPVPLPPPRTRYIFRDQDSRWLRDYYRGEVVRVDRYRRVPMVIGMQLDMAYIQPLPPSLYAQLPPPPPGYQIGYFEGYSVVYDPATGVIFGFVDLLD